MHNLRHFYYQNKEKIWKVVLIIAFLLGIIYFLNMKSMEEIKNPTSTPEDGNNNINYSDEQNKTYISDKSPISGGTVTEQVVQEINNTISKFLNNCKNGQAEEAYNMLSNDCKQIEYKTLEKFQTKYLNTKFNKDDVYEIEKWIDDTYKISISQDLLSTGNVSGNEKITEYITIVEENNEKKLNINGYIGQKEINKEKVQDNVKITVLSKRTYMDYEIYDFKIENLSNKVIKIDSLESTESMYLKDVNENKYDSYSHEIFEDDLVIKSNREKNLSIKYSKTYSKRNRIENIVFENIILDYIKYKKIENIKEFDNISKIKIEL